MVFNSQEFLIFFPVVVLIYFVIPRKIRYIWLLIASYYFYMSWNVKYSLLLAVSTAVTYLCGLMIGKYTAKGNTRGAKWSVALTFVINLGILAVFKYANFILASVSAIASFLGLNPVESRLDVLLPVGISFYTFQALSYVIDVYRGEIAPERNILKYALFVSFFPQLVAGPIERSVNLMPQIQNLHNIKVWNFDRIKDGFFMMMWGLFQKIVIADRASAIVENVFDNYTQFGFVEILAALFLFAIQIYCDFGGYSNIAIGAAQVMGINLMQNSRQPYFAQSIKDIWSRWHISLTTWFRDYLYIPLGGSRKGKLRKYLNILIIFSVSGLWHGASWHYVIWGVVNALFQIIGEIKDTLLDKTGLKFVHKKSFSVRFRKTFITWILWLFSLIFFGAATLGQSFGMIGQMASKYYVCGITELGLNSVNLWILGVSILILFIVDLLHEKNIKIRETLMKQEIWFRWILCLGLVWSIIMFGIYGAEYDASTFIYFQF